MKFAKNIKEIEFNTVTMYGEEIELSEPIVMASAAGWYVGKVCKAMMVLSNLMIGSQNI